jgi:N-acyl-D-amino-acid deacylase
VRLKKGLDDVGGGANVTITHCARHPDYEMRNLADIAQSLNTDTVSLYMQIVKDGGANVVCHAMKEDDIRTFYQAPWVMVGSDGGIGMRHPRGAGTYPRVLGEYVRNRQWLTLPAAIRKMTSLPATQLKLKDRGAIAKGNFADLVLFNPAKVIDGSTFADPQKLSTGIEKVWVNGAMVWEDNKPAGALPGRVVK